MVREEKSKRMFKAIDDVFSRYKGNERDVPANQICQNLELLISDPRSIINTWKKMNFEEKLGVELALAYYKNNVRIWARANGINIPNLDSVDAMGLARLEEIHHRQAQKQEIEGRIVEGREGLTRLINGKEYTEDLYKAYGDLIYHDKRTKPNVRNELLFSLKPIVQQEFIKMIEKRGEVDSYSGDEVLFEESKKMEEDISPLIQVGKRETSRALVEWQNPNASEDVGDGSYDTALVKVDRGLIEAYVRRFYMLENIIKMIYFRIQEEENKLTRLLNENKTCKSLTTEEENAIRTFDSGRNMEYNIGKHLADLDIMRFMIERYIRSGR